MTDIIGRVDQRDVGKRLRKIAELALRPDIVFLGEEPDIVAQADQPLEELPCVSFPSSHHVGVGQPKTHRQKRALSRRQTVHAGSGGVVAQHQSAPQQSFLDRRDGPAHTRIVGRQKAYLGYQQRARIQKIAVIRLGEGAQFGIECAPADLFVDLGPDPTPVLDRTIESKQFDALDGAIERDPDHDLGMGEVTAFTAHYHPGDQMQMINFMKNICMAGGFLQVVAFGAGRLALGRS